MSRKIKRGICTFLIVICALGAVLFGTMIVQTNKGYKQGDEDLQLVEQVRGETPAPISRAQKEEMDEASRRSLEEEEHRVKLEGYKRLAAENPDVIGWIRSEGTVIDYPVMQTPNEPDYYLRRGFDQKYSVYGMIYMDASCRLDESCSNYILYGYHMKNGTMFASIEEYKSEKYYKEHSIIEFDTLDETGTYEVVAAFKLMADQMDRDFAYKLAAGTKEDYDNLMDYVRTHGFYNTGVTAEWPEQLLTLTTCEYTQKDGRFFVIAKRIGK